MERTEKQSGSRGKARRCSNSVAISPYRMLGHKVPIQSCCWRRRSRTASSTCLRVDSDPKNSGVIIAPVVKGYNDYNRDSLHTNNEGPGEGVLAGVCEAP